MYQKLEQKVILSGTSQATLKSYGRSIAHIALFFNKIPLELSDEVIKEYLAEIRSSKNPSETYFKHTVYGLRYLFRLFGREDRAISNYRIEQVKNGEVTFKYKVYKKGGKVESMSLPTMEFIRRFALHILPHGFARMRHYGILSSRGQSTQLPVIQSNMNIIRVKKSKTQLHDLALKRLKSDNARPCCGHKNLKTLCHFPRGEPPDEGFILNLVLNL